MDQERTVLVVSIGRPTWDQPLELCRCLSAEAMADVVRSLYHTEVVNQPDTVVTVRKEVNY